MVLIMQVGEISVSKNVGGIIFNVYMHLASVTLETKHNETRCL